jgi:hypothetical protein
MQMQPWDLRRNTCSSISRVLKMFSKRKEGFGKEEESMEETPDEDNLDSGNSCSSSSLVKHACKLLYRNLHFEE